MHECAERCHKGKCGTVSTAQLNICWRLHSTNEYFQTAILVLADANPAVSVRIERERITLLQRVSLRVEMQANQRLQTPSLQPESNLLK